MLVNIAASWQKVLEPEFTKPYFVKLTDTIEKAYLKQTIYPEPANVFKAFSLCPFEDVKVVILGQDPYHGPHQAHGLAFSVAGDTKTPPSLQNIYKEIKNDLSTAIPENGNLEHWAKQGILLLNSTLTVESGQPASHQGFGWETFTDQVIKTISDQKGQVIFLLWGKYAQSKALFIDDTKHLILQAPHPSPFSAHKGFFGCRHFSQTNTYLKNHSLSPIKW